MKHYALAALTRIALGLTLLWAFFDKVFGWGFATTPEAAWLVGNSPTTGFLNYATKGPFTPLFQGLAGAAWVDVLFMAGLLGVGLAFTLGIVMKLASKAGALLMVLIYLAVLPPEHHPFLDDHIINALLFLLLPAIQAEKMWSLNSWWQKQDVVKNVKWLQ